MDYDVDRYSGVPLSRQLLQRLRSAIERGELAPGAQLPSLRDTAAAAGVNVNTVRSVYTKLEEAGIVRTEQGRGTFVAVPSSANEAKRRRDLSAEIARLEAELVGLPLQLFPHQSRSTRARSSARILSLDELATIRDLLAERVHALQAARSEVVEELDRSSIQPANRESARYAPEISHRSSSSVNRGVRIRWVGA
jgi:GntR family transcriptional regulator